MSGSMGVAAHVDTPRSTQRALPLQSSTGVCGQWFVLYPVTYAYSLDKPSRTLRNSK
jgi:hypothetical protein